MNKYKFGTPETLIDPICYIIVLFSNTGDSPSGKALVSGTSIRGFESLIPSQDDYA